MTSPDGTVNLIVENELHDSRSATYQQEPGSDLIKIVNCSGRVLTAAGEGPAFMELLDAHGALIGSAILGVVPKGYRVAPMSLRARPPLVVK